MRIVKYIQTVFFVIALGISTNAQTDNNMLTSNERKVVLEAVKKLVNEQYIDADLAVNIVKYLDGNSKKGMYDTITDPNEFAGRLTDDLIAVSNDKHFHLVYDPAWVADSKKAISKEQQDELLNRDLAHWKKDNFGFKEVKILDGNIGYVNMESFTNPIYGGKTIEGVMALLSNADAIIIDLRRNGGGFSTMVQLMASYFFEGEPLQMVDFHSREAGKHTQDWTLPYVSGTRLPNVDLYILTSKESFSAAEGFAYFMQNRKRAVIVGETTGGAAQPVDRIAVSDRFYIMLPTQKPVDPVTNTNWEGVGVKPDLQCSSKEALIAAQIEALKGLHKKKVIEDISYEWISSELKVKQNPITVNTNKLKLYAGDYAGRKLVFENGDLFYQKDGAEKHKLIALSDDLFMLSDINYLRIKINIENDKVTAITRLYLDGTTKKDPKVKS